MFSFDISDKLKEILSKLSRKDQVRAAVIYKKIEEVINSDENSIEHYKNLKHDLSEYKRVHIGKSFILMFKVTKSEKHILFGRLKHHDDAYK